jgi:Skp family chaperone for outer membrane proteins
MTKKMRLALLVAVAGGLIAGCGQLPGGAGVAVIDLAAIAKATGHDKVMEKQMEAARAELGSQLTQVAGNLEKQLQDEQARLGGAAAAAREKGFQQQAAQARQQLAQTQALAQQKAQEFQIGLAARYREAVQPIAGEMARANGARVLLVSDPSLLWFDAAVDITDEVIAELRANPVQLPPPSGAESAPPAAPDGAADTG